MIPRYAPTYTYATLLASLKACHRPGVDEQLRSRLATLYGVKNVFLVASARVALYALLKAYNRPGGVLLPAYNCIVVPEAVHYAGYEPVLVDVDCRSLNTTAEAMEGALPGNISVALVTHIFGIPAQVDEHLCVLRKHDVLVVEDAAPALGATYRGRLVGTLGDAGIISFQSTKVIAGGAGGALLTNDDELARKAGRLLEVGAAPAGWGRALAEAAARKVALSSWAYLVTQFGYRLLRRESMYEVVAPQMQMPPRFLKPASRFTSALVLNQLDRLEWNLGRRRELAQIYLSRLSGHPSLTLPSIPEGSSPAWIQFPILADDKRSLYKHMQRHGIDLSWTYRYSCADSFGLAGFPKAREAAKRVLGLPTYPSLTDEDAHTICDVACRYPTSPS